MLPYLEKDETRVDRQRTHVAKILMELYFDRDNTITTDSFYQPRPCY